MPKLTTRHDPAGHGIVTVHMPHVDGPIGEITPHLVRPGEPTLDYRGHVTLAGKHVGPHRTDTCRISGIVGPSRESVLATLQRMADDFYGGGDARGHLQRLAVVPWYLWALHCALLVGVIVAAARTLPRD